MEATNQPTGALRGRRNPLIAKGIKLVAGEAQVAGFATSSQRLTRWDEGWAEVIMDATEAHRNPMDTLHGGYTSSLADTAMGMAYISTLKDDETFTTLDMHTSFLRPFWNGRLTAFAEVVKRGRTIGRVDAVVRDDQGREVARATSTCMTLRGHEAQGR